MSVSVSSQSGRNQEFSTRAARWVAQEFLMSLFPSLLNDYLEVGQGGKRLVRVLVTVTDLLQDSAEYRMFGHPTRYSLDFVTTACRFLHDDSDCNMITRYGPFSQVVRDMGITMKITRLCYRYMNERSVNLDSVRSVPSAAVSFLAKFGCAISRACGNN